MASIGNDPNGHKRILFVAPDGKRKTIRLGKATMKQAVAFKVKIEALLGQVITGNVDEEVSRWLAGLDAPLYGKLAAVGLVPDRTRAKLGEFMDAYAAGRTDTKPLTRRNYGIFRRRILRFFDAGRDLRSFTEADADAFSVWLRGNYAEATAGRTIKMAKQFFKAAARAKIIRDNPFADQKATGAPNEARKAFVSREVIAEVLNACPDAEWRLIVALSRYGGLRCPSEHLALDWRDVDWTRGRFLVNSTKTGPRQGEITLILRKLTVARNQIECMAIFRGCRRA